MNACGLPYIKGFPGGSDNKASVCNAGDPGSIPGLRRSPGEGNGNPLKFYCLENSIDGGAWWATIHGVARSRTQLSDFTFKKIRDCKRTFHGKMSTLKYRNGMDLTEAEDIKRSGNNTHKNYTKRF